MSSLLVGVSTVDLPTYGIVSIALLGVALIASYLAARRAARTDPLVTLREG
jgi:ABC-type lipoprotein release transport system permease subunit